VFKLDYILNFLSHSHFLRSNGQRDDYLLPVVLPGDIHTHVHVL